MTLIFCASPNAQAVTKAWDAGSTTGDWNLGNNWFANGVPLSGDDVIFDNSQHATTLEDIFLNAAQSVNTLTINLTASNQNWNLGADNGTSSFTLTLATGSISVLSTSGTGTYIIGATSGGSGIGIGIMTLATSAAGFTLNDSRTNGGLLQINTIVSGSNKNVTKTGAGEIVLSGVNTYTGVTTLSAGILAVSTISNGGVASNLGQATNAAANLVFDGGELDYTGATASTDRNFTINTGKTATIDIVTNTLTISGASTGTNGALTKLGAGTLILSGANAYTGSTTISAGTLILANSSGSALGSTSSIVINSSGTVRLGVSNQINNSSTMTLNGGTFNTAGFSERQGAGATVTPGLGALTLSSSSTIDLGAGASILAFANSSAQTWSGTLKIYNWSGTPGIGDGTDQVYFGTDSTSLTAAQLSQIAFYSDSGTTFLGPAGFTTGLDGEIGPVPEPATCFAAALGAGAIAWFQRRRFSRIWGISRQRHGESGVVFF